MGWKRIRPGTLIFPQPSPNQPTQIQEAGGNKERSEAEGNKSNQRETREPAVANESGPGTEQGQEQEQKQEQAQEQVDADAITFSDPASGAYRPRAHVHSVTHSHAHTIIQPHGRRPPSLICRGAITPITRSQGRKMQEHVVAGA